MAFLACNQPKNAHNMADQTFEKVTMRFTCRQS